MHDSLGFREYQEQACRTNHVKGGGLNAIMVPLLGLAGEAGSLLSEYKKWLREGDRYKPFTDQVSEEIGDILWYLANIAEKAGLDLQEIAEENLAKLQDRWGTSSNATPNLFPASYGRYDSSFPVAQQLPESFRVEFREQLVDGRKKLVITHEENSFGDALTDNSHADDGYRFHDVFHFTLATCLGWSPIVRRLLGRKRKAVPQVDKVEDGARAAATEEAITALVFGFAKDFSLFKESESVDYELLRAIKLTTRTFEVRDRSYRDWEQAILAAFRVWREMIDHRGGVFLGDAKRRTVDYESLANEVHR